MAHKRGQSPSGPGLPASAATPVTMATPIMSAPTPLANAATPAATAPTPGVAPSPVIPTVAVFSPVVSAPVYFDYLTLIVVIRRNASHRVCNTFVLTPDGSMQDVIRYNFFWILGLFVWK